MRQGIGTLVVLSLALGGSFDASPSVAGLAGGE
jgi:hypothetical protein